jgi:hypothetical protein
MGAGPIWAAGPSAATPRNIDLALYLCPFGQGQRVLDVDAQITNGALDLGVAEKDLNGAKIARSL